MTTNRNIQKSIVLSDLLPYDLDQLTDNFGGGWECQAAIARYDKRLPVDSQVHSTDHVFVIEMQNINPAIRTCALFKEEGVVFQDPEKVESVMGNQEGKIGVPQNFSRAIIIFAGCSEDVVFDVVDGNTFNVFRQMRIFSRRTLFGDALRKIGLEKGVFGNTDDMGEFSFEMFCRQNEVGTIGDESGFFPPEIGVVRNSDPYRHRSHTQAFQAIFFTGLFPEEGQIFSEHFVE